ncbi:hypothetical protein ACE1N8_07465 [Streptomyces sp. DSM 116494]|uniref:hypothetical protein n=1 Tax=Streptomyces TaxID=1883 RepID=UPI00365D6584
MIATPDRTPLPRKFPDRPAPDGPTARRPTQAEGRPGQVYVPSAHGTSRRSA